ncbi:MAG TPA: 4-(cytidine 5'-diphospho)-2-C-methyl-D-erythritol kinase [Sporichthyaceae bacterium]|jgi:4-diphosphocytidyl-2-C-methyl-D-erythritol kinase|nr:4-(cytidine 5'-diphospho)-2-C-methyl-D-erythritol kinase [Sporichthyaceae bacterium]
MSVITVRAPAKVNLQLSVGPPRPDGYHDLLNVFQAVSLHDEVSAEDAEDFTVSVVAASGGPDLSGVPEDGNNLALRAARLLAERTGICDGVRLRIRKAIPVAAGMAGGSADAAAALVACDALWQTHLRREELTGLAAQLGADVPFALLGNTAVGVGRGDVLSPVLGRGQFHWVFALADHGLSTPAVYAECDRLREVDPDWTKDLREEVDPGLLAALRSGDAPALGAALYNDLTAAALSLSPRLADTLALGPEQGALGSIVCGSGPTCAFLVSSAAAALDLAVALTAMGLCRDVKRAVGPVGGARLLGGIAA